MANTYRTPLLPFPLKRQQQFWKTVKTLAADQCWEWQGTRTDRDYGTVYIRRKVVKAHRVAFAITFGIEPPDSVLHHCDNPPCCNPAHLYAGTYKDNAQDKQRRGRSPWIMYTTGEDAPSSKLNGTQVDQIRLYYRPRNGSGDRLAQMFGVNKGTIVSVAHGRSWCSRPWPVGPVPDPLR